MADMVGLITQLVLEVKEVGIDCTGEREGREDFYFKNLGFVRILGMWLN